MYLKIGDKAPDFTLKNYVSKNISLSDLNNSGGGSFVYNFNYG